MSRRSSESVTWRSNLEGDLRVSEAAIKVIVLLFEEPLHLSHQLLVLGTHGAQTALMASVVLVGRGGGECSRSRRSATNRPTVPGIYRRSPAFMQLTVRREFDQTHGVCQAIDGITRSQARSREEKIGRLEEYARERVG